MNFKDALTHMRDGLAELAALAAKLENQNLADIIKASEARIAQALEHPDVEAVLVPGEEPAGAEGAPPAFEPTPGAPPAFEPAPPPAAPEPGAAPANQ